MSIVIHYWLKTNENKLYIIIISHLLRFTIAAQELVSEARGHFTGQGWKKRNGDTASFDDITVMIIPILTYLNQWKAGHLLDSGIT
jgi:hypothetical protein